MRRGTSTMGKELVGGDMETGRGTPAVGVEAGATARELAALLRSAACAMCASELGREPATILPCCHAFHAECVAPLLRGQGASCPLCGIPFDSGLETGCDEEEEEEEESFEASMDQYLAWLRWSHGLSPALHAEA